MSDMRMGQPAGDSGDGGGGLKIPILFGAVIALLASNVWLFLQLDKLRVDMDKVQVQMDEKLSDVRQTANASNQTNRRNVEALQEQLETARRQAAMAVGQAKVEADQKVAQMSSRLEAEQRKTKEQLTTEIATKTQEVAAAADTKIGEVKTDVASVKTDVTSTKTELERTIGDLKKVTGDLGVQSGYIATNSKDLEMLKRLGERNYYEFNLGKSKTPTRIGDIMVQLKKADLKRNRYTVEVTVDDKRIEKKDKTVNEPVQFLTSKARQPYEFVVNEVRKDVIVGYLATPKVMEPRK
jgi:F0F1-type ATP synthase membrane subunit b/b'